MKNKKKLHFAKSLMVSLTLSLIFPNIGLTTPGKKGIDTLVLNVSYENGHALISKLDGAVESGNLIAESDQGNNNLYFLIRSGIKSWDKNSRLSKIFYTLPKKTETVCKIINPLENSSFSLSDNINSLNEKFNVLRKCFKYKVEDPQKEEIEYDSNQADCQIEKINPFSLLLGWGSDCFLKTKSGQELNVEIIPDTKCIDRSYLVENKVSPMELFGMIQTYVYPRGEIGIFFEPKKNLWEKAVQINLNPGKELLNQNETHDVDGIPFVRPNHFILPEFMVSDLGFENFGEDRAKIDLKFLISTNGGKSLCQNELCSNYLNYDIPFAPLLIIKGINPQTGRSIELASTPIGDRLPPNWNGELFTWTLLKDFHFEVGKKYLLELIFSDPTNSYLELKSNYKSLFKLGGLSSGRGSRTGTIGSIGSMGGMGGMGSLGSVGGLEGISEDNISGGLGGLFEIPRMAQTINDPTFPSQYSFVCNKSLTVCNKSTLKEQQKLVIKFEVKNIEGEKVILGDDITIEQTGNLYPSYKGKFDLTKKPTIKCSSN